MKENSEIEADKMRTKILEENVKSESPPQSETIKTIYDAFAIKNEPKEDSSTATEYTPITTSYSGLARKLGIKQEPIDEVVASNPNEGASTDSSLPHRKRVYFNVLIKNEVVDEETEPELSQQGDNGCTNSGCDAGKQCLQPYTCNKCDKIFMSADTFVQHFKICAARASKRAPVNSHEFSQDLKLIECIKKHPAIYNIDHAEHRSPQGKDILWANIASQCNFTNGIAAKTAWKKIKDGFRQALLQQQQNKTHTFKYQTQLEFLLPFWRTSGSSNVVVPDVTEKSHHRSADMNDSQASPAKKARTSSTSNEPTRHVNRQPNRTSWHPLEMFFQSMCETTKNLPSHLQLQVKRNVFQAVIDAEELAGAVEQQATTSDFPFVVASVTSGENNSFSEEED